MRRIWVTAQLKRQGRARRKGHWSEKFPQEKYYVSALYVGFAR